MIAAAIMMKWYSIKELVKEKHNNTQHQKGAHQNSSIDCGGVQLINAHYHMVPIYTS